MLSNIDDAFYNRADAHIRLADDQLKEVEGPGKVSASILYAAARFNAWTSARGFASAEHMAAAREETLKYFCEQYRLMLEENFNDYVTHFEKYIEGKK